MSVKQFSSVEPLEVEVSEFKIENVIKPEFLEQIKKIYSDKYDIRITELAMILLSKSSPKSVPIKASKEGKKHEIIIGVGHPNALKFVHNNETQYASGRAVINSSNKEILKLFLDKYGK